MTEHPADASPWLPAARQGSAEALGQALEACRGYLLTIAQRELDPTLRAKGGASDLVQETFLKAHRAFPRFDGESDDDLRAWLRQLLLHTLADFQRQYRQTHKRQIGREVALRGGESSAPGWVPADGAPSPSAEAVLQEQNDATGRALARLPDEYRRVLLLRYQENRSFEEIGRLLDRSANAARKLLVRALARIQEEMKQAP